MQSEAANRYTDFATQLSAEGAPARQQSQNYYSSIVKGGPEAYKVIAPQVDFAKQQFANAQRGIADSAPAGGAFSKATQNLAATQAQTISGLYRDNIQKALEALSQSGQFDTGAGLTATGGVSSAANGFAQLSASQANAWASGLSGIAGPFGMLLGGLGKTKPPGSP